MKPIDITITTVCGSNLAIIATPVDHIISDIQNLIPRTLIRDIITKALYH